MTKPTVEARLQRRFIVMSSDQALIDALEQSRPEGWELVVATDLDQIGEFHDVLLHRFLLLDLDDRALDALDIIRTIRMEYMLNIAIFCFGGDAELRDQARLNRADRFFERDEIVEKMKLFCHQYRWGDES